MLVPIKREAGDVVLDVHSEKPRDYNHPHHDPNDVENIIFTSFLLAAHAGSCTGPLNRAHYSAAVTRAPFKARPICMGISPVIIPAAIGPAPLLVAPICFMMTDSTACPCPE